MSTIENYPNLRPSLLLDFANSGRIHPRISCVRASTATCFGSDGKLRTVANNVPRTDFDAKTGRCLGLLIEEARTNFIRNNSMVGAVAGVPGVMPTNWSATTPTNGLSREVVGIGVEDGIDYIDIRWQGTAAAATTVMAIAQFEPNTGIAATVGQTWSFGAYVRLVAGSLSGINSILLRGTMRDAAGVNLGSMNSSNLAVTNAPLASQRYVYSQTLTEASTAFFSSLLVMGYSAGAVIDITLRIGLPQMELGAFLTSSIRTAGTAVTRAADQVWIDPVLPGTEFSVSCAFVPAFRSEAWPVVFSIGPPSGVNGANVLRVFCATLSTQARLPGNTLIASGSAVALDSTNRVALSVGQSGAAMAINGAIAGTTSSQADFAMLKRLYLGSLGGSSGYLCGRIQRLAIYPKSLTTQQQLQRLTA